MMMRELSGGSIFEEYFSFKSIKKKIYPFDFDGFANTYIWNRYWAL